MKPVLGTSLHWLLVAFLLLGSVGSVRAYTYYVSDLNGVPVRWFKSAVELKVSTVEPGEVSLDDLNEIIQTALDTWNVVLECDLPLLIHGGTTEVAVGEAPEEIDDFSENVIVIIHSPEVWSAKGYSSSLLAITSLTYDRQEGLLVDTDIEINDWNHEFSAEGEAVTGKNDLLNTVTHEMGHLLGMDHSEVKDATMYGQAPDGEDKKRTLHEDDIQGVCDLYSEFSVAEPATTVDGSLAEAPDDTGTCCQTHLPPGHPIWAYGFMLVSLVLLRSSRRSLESP